MNNMASVIYEEFGNDEAVKNLQRQCRKSAYREKCIEEMLCSVTIGAFGAIILTVALPGITSKMDVLGFFFGFWTVLTITVWSVIDIRDWMNRHHVRENIRAAVNERKAKHRNSKIVSFDFDRLVKGDSQCR